MRKLLGALLIWLALCAPALATVTLVQLGFGNGGTGTTITTVAAISAGDAVVVCSGANSGGHGINGVTDTAGDTFQPILVPSQATNPLGCYFTPSSLGQLTSTSITVSYASTSSNHGTEAFKITGMTQPVVTDFVSSTVNGTSTGGTAITAITGPTMNTATDVVIGFVIATTNPGTVSTLGTLSFIGGSGTPLWAQAYGVVSTTNAAVTWQPTLQNSVAYRSALLAFMSSSSVGMLQLSGVGK